MKSNRSAVPGARETHRRQHRGQSRHNNPQLIFESLNPTGLELSQADLIRNYVLMGLEPRRQESLYIEYWYPMERSFEPGGRGLRSSTRSCGTTSRSGPGRSRTSAASTRHSRRTPRSTEHDQIEAIVRDVHRYSQFFVRMALGQDEDKEVREAFADINTLKVNVAYPFFLELYDDYHFKAPVLASRLLPAVRPARRELRVPSRRLRNPDELAEQDIRHARHEIDRQTP